MKRFKLIFQVVYVLIALVVFYFSIDILMNTQEYLSRIKLSSYVKFPKYIMTVFLFVSIFMLVYFVLEKFHIYKIKGGISQLKEEILHLKAKLYDQNGVDAPADHLLEEGGEDNEEDETQ